MIQKLIMHGIFLQTTFPSDHGSKPLAKSFLALLSVRITISEIAWFKINQGLRLKVKRSSETLDFKISILSTLSTLLEFQVSRLQDLLHISFLDQQLEFYSQFWASGLSQEPLQRSPRVPKYHRSYPFSMYHLSINS